jgi:HK97 family phage prohead protease
MKAYSLFEVKSLSDERRILSGMASTPTPDRDGDRMDPFGMQVDGIVNLFLYHKHDHPVGRVEFGRPSKKGIPFEAVIPEVQEEGIVKSRVDEAWHSVKYKLLQAVSIGFRASREDVDPLPDGTIHYKRWRLFELSLVGVPANPEALISAFKSLDTAQIREQMGLEAQADPERRALVEKALRGAVPLIGLPKPQPENLNGAVRLTRS